MRYQFSQLFDAPAESAYRWCIDYRQDDWKRMGKIGTRKIKRINEDTLILTDTVGGVTKHRLVRMNGERLAWTNTHTGGPNKHSQFWYQIVRLGKSKSRLDFVGLQINYGRRPPATKVAAIAEELKKEDSQMWVLLAMEMSKDHKDPKERKEGSQKT